MLTALEWRIPVCPQCGLLIPNPDRPWPPKVGFQTLHHPCGATLRVAFWVRQRGDTDD